MYKNILLDLDGTITDSGRAILSSVRYALAKFGYHNESDEKLRRFIGPSLMDSFTNIYGMNQEDATKATAYYREVYEGGRMFDVELYPGILSFIQKMHQEGRNVILVTAKPHVFAAQILEKLDLTSYFAYQTGPELNDPSSDKQRLIEKAIQDCNLKREECIMIGDTHYDIDGAVGAKITSVGVSYGYGLEEELRSAGATHIAHSVEDLYQFV